MLKLLNDTDIKGYAEPGCGVCDEYLCQMSPCDQMSVISTQKTPAFSTAFILQSVLYDRVMEINGINRLNLLHIQFSF